MSSSYILIFFVAILVVGSILFAVMTLTKKASPQLDADKYRSKWMAIEQQLKRDDSASHQLCVLGGDKLVDQALRERNIKGQTMGERMKTAGPMLSNAGSLWNAHKLRNQIAHESDARVSFDDARVALSGFKQALKDLGAI